MKPHWNVKECLKKCILMYLCFDNKMLAFMLYCYASFAEEVQSRKRCVTGLSQPLLLSAIV